MPTIARNRLSHGIQLLLLLALVGLTVLGLLPLQSLVGHRLDLLKRDTLAQLERVTGREITYDSISPSIFRSLEIRGLRIYDTDPAHSELLYIRQVEVSYDIFRLLTADPLLALGKITIANTSLSINTTTDRDLIVFLRSVATGWAAAQTNGGLPARIVDHLELSGKNLTLSVTSPVGTFSIDRLFFQVQNGAQGLDIAVSGGLRALLADRPAGISDIDTQVAVSGMLDRNLQWSDMRVRFEKLSSNVVTLVRPTFQISLRDGIWQVRKIQDKAPIDLLATYDRGKGTVSLSFSADHFRPSYYFAFGPALSALDPWISTVMSGTGSLAYSLKTGSLTYAADVQLALNNRELPAPMSIETSLSGNLERADISSLDVRSGLGDGHYSGSVDLRTMLPSGELSVTDVQTPIGGRLSGNFAFAEAGGALTVKSDVLTIGAASLRDFALSATPAPGTVGFHVSSRFAEGPEGGSLSADGSYQTGASPFLQVSITTASAPLAVLYSMLFRERSAQIEDSLRDLTVTTQAYLATDLAKVSFVSPETTISSVTRADRSLALSFSGNDRNVDITRFAVDWDGHRGAGALSADFSAKGRVALAASLKVQGVDYKAEGFVINGESLVVTGSYGMNLVAFRQAKRYVFWLTTSRFPVPFRNVETKVSLDVSGFYADPGAWEVLSRGSSFADLPYVGTKNSHLTLSARLSSSAGDVYSIVYGDSVSTVRGNGHASLRRSGGVTSGSGWLQLSGSGAKERYDARLDFEGDRIRSVVSFAGAPLARIGALPFTGSLNGSLAVEGSVENPQVTANLSIPNGLLNSSPFSASTTLRVESGRLDYRSLAVRYLTHALSGGRGSIDFRKGTLSLSAAYHGVVNGDTIDAHVAAQSATSSPPVGAFPLSFFRGEFRADASVTDVRVGGRPAAPWTLNASRKGGKIAFAGGPSEAIEGYLLDTGTFSVSLADPLPIRLQANGTLSGSTVDASLDDVVLNLHAFGEVVKVPYFAISKGTARGRLKIEGPINDPDIVGNLSADDVYGRTVVVADEIGPFSTNIAFHGKSFAMPNVVLHSGKSTVLGNLSFTIDHWLPSAFDVSFKTENPTGLHVKSGISGIDFDGFVVGSVFIVGDPLQVSVSGNLLVDSCAVTLGHLGAPANAPEEDNTNYSFTLTTGKRVVFLWPSGSLPIFRGYADNDQTIRIQSNGSTGDFSIVGDVNFRGGEVYYFRQSFYLEQGEISFNEDQDKVDPLLNARAEIHEADQSGRAVTIYLVVDNKPLSQFAPRLESDPPMSNPDLLALLGQSIYTQYGGQELDLSSAVLATSDILGQFSVVRTFEQKVLDVTGLDLFSFRTDLLQNLVLERVFGQSIGPSETSASYLGQYLDNTTIYLGKYVGPNLFLEAMINLQMNTSYITPLGTIPNYWSTSTYWRSPNNQVPAGAGIVPSLQPDYEVLLQWRTPLFLVELSFLPDPSDLVASLVDTSFSLSWALSF